MGQISKFSLAVAAMIAGLAGMVPVAQAGDSDIVLLARGDNGKGKPGGNDGGDPPPPPAGGSYYSWMHSGIQDAWTGGFDGTGATITVIDDFSSRQKLRANLGDGQDRLRHGEWTLKQAGMIAFGATMQSNDVYDFSSFTLDTSGFNALNLSYSIKDPSGIANYNHTAQEDSIISYASGGAFISKSAGNDGVQIGTADGAGDVDYLALSLMGTSSTIFVGALDGNGSVSDPASLAWYSNYAGNNTTVQAQYLVVGVESGITGLAGTSFAAPIVAGYAAILHDKFGADPNTIASHLLNTASMEGLAGGDGPNAAGLYGQGQARIDLAIAPASIN